MKKVIKIIAVLLVVSLVLPIVIAPIISNASNEPELRGVWVASVVNIDYPSKPTSDPEALKTEALKILDAAKAMRMNAVFLQVRPTSDALYKSKYFPWSKYLTGVQGLAPKDGFDPLEFWVSEAHKRGIQLHAWVNPYRITKKLPSEPAQELGMLSPTNPAAMHPDWVVKYMDDLYYNPGIPEVRQLVIDGVLELIQNYDIDGIHFDDYFYPGKAFEDGAAFAQYGAGFANVDDWRRDNVNILIRDLSEAIRNLHREIRFGISPFGIWANKSSDPMGSDTKGNQSYFNQYADTRKWVKEGWLDYIAPQLYWNIGYSIADYSKLLTWWQDVVKDTGVRLYIGQAAYRACDPSPSSPWYGAAELEKQLQLNAKSPEVAGSIFFSYKSLEDNPALGAVVKGIYERKDGVIASVPISIAVPANNIRTSLSQFYVYGSSDPEKILLMNGKEVEGRSKEGYFGILVPLKQGQNVLTFSQEGSYDTTIIYRETASSAASKMNAADIIASSVFPMLQEYRSPGEKITLTCRAPIGAYVTVKIGDKTFAMKPANTKAPAPGIYATTYTYVYTISNYNGAARVISLGAPEYSMNYYGTKKVRKAPSVVYAIMKNAPIYAEVIKDVADTYNTPTTANGAAFELYSGMVDYITGISGSYVRLSSGQWMNKSDVRIYASDKQLRSSVDSISYKTGEKWDSLVLGISGNPTAFASFDGTSLMLDIPKTDASLLPVLPEASPISAATVTGNDDKLQYVLTLKAGQYIDGYYIEKTSTGLTLNIKRPIKAKEGDLPLAGIRIMLDPGHGGSDSGAVGPLGLKYSEKRINLSTSLKLKAELEGLGATVLMTRTSDAALSLEQRLAASRDARPDLFISIHANSMGDNVDISKVEGFSVFYREELARRAAASVLDHTIQSLGRNSKGVHDKNFYVTRGTWTPSILFESGFVPNPIEFAWLIDESEQAKLAKTVAEAIVIYFKN